jgi:hypothetical protein
LIAKSTLWPASADAALTKAGGKEFDFDDEDER